MIGYCHLRQAAVRSFRIDRMGELEILPVTFETPQDFDIQAYLAVEPQPQLPVRLRFAPLGVELARNQAFYWSGIEDQPDGSLVVTFPAYDLEYAVATVLSYGPLVHPRNSGVQVLEPKALHNLICERARAILEAYGNQRS